MSMNVSIYMYMCSWNNMKNNNISFWRDIIQRFIVPSFALKHIKHFNGKYNAEMTTSTTHYFLLAGVSGGFYRGSPVFAHLLIGPSHMS